MAGAGPPDLLLLNARAATMDPRLPHADAVAVTGGRISWAGAAERNPAPAAGRTRVIDCGGATVLPGFVDAHCHVLAYAASLLEVDCRPRAARSIDGIVDAIRRRASTTPPGEWVRAHGYREDELPERRHPNRRDLDRAAPHNPVRLAHRSRHAAVLNTAGLSAAGVGMDTDEPTGGTIDRDPRTGEPTGLLLEMSGWLSERLPPIEPTLFDGAVRLADRKLLSRGVTTLADAGVNNTPATWNTFARLKSDGLLTPRVVMMAGARHLDQFHERGLRHGAGDGGLRLGHAKIMATASAGPVAPAPRELEALAERAVRSGFPVAVHAVEEAAVRAAVAALSTIAGLPGQPALPHRIEHCSECPAELIGCLARLGVAVVTNPLFIDESGDRYLSTTRPDALPALYRVRSLLDAGVQVAAGSDAPVTSGPPLLGVHAAVTRLTGSRQTAGWGERVSLDEALAMHTRTAAAVCGLSDVVGAIVPGKAADLAILDTNLTDAGPEALLDARVALTIVGGEVVWGG